MDWLSANWLALTATGISFLALSISWIAYRQRVRFHPQPKLVIEWEPTIKPVSTGLFVRAGELHNYGDAAARDVRVRVEYARTTDNAPWQRWDVLAEGETQTIIAPVVRGMKRASGILWASFELAPDSGYKMVTPAVTVTWRQPPFDGPVKALHTKPPTTPDLTSGQMS